MNNWIMPFPVMSLYRFDLYWVNLTQEQKERLEFSLVTKKV